MTIISKRDEALANLISVLYVMEKKSLENVIEGEYDFSEEQGGVYIPPDTSKTRLLICGQSSNQPNTSNINDTRD